MRIRILPILLILLMTLVAACSTKPRPRGLGIGLRQGINQPNANFRTDGEEIISTNNNVNANHEQRFPLFIQAEEDLITNWLFTQWFFDVAQANVVDIPPVLDNITYSELETANTVNGEKQAFSVESSQTKISIFYNKSSNYQSLIDARSEPSLSADYSETTLTAGKSWGVFYPYSESSRWVTLGIGLGVGYTEGMYSVNLCDPFVVTADTIEGISGFAETRKGECQGKTELYKNRISNLGLAINVILKIYSYVGDTFEINFIEADVFQNQLPAQEIASEENILEPQFGSQYTNVVSLVYRF